jgi:hypothetical protein
MKKTDEYMDEMKVDVKVDENDERKVLFTMLIGGVKTSYACTYFEKDKVVVSHISGGYPLLRLIEKQKRDVIVIRNKKDNRLLKMGYVLVPHEKKKSRFFYKKCYV